MTDDGIDWGDQGSEAEGLTGESTPAQPGMSNVTAPPPAYPEYSDNPHNHRYTISVTGSGAPMVVVRANTAAECNAAFNELEAYGVWANIGAAHAALKAQGTLGAGLGPVSPVPAPQGPPMPPQGVPQGPPFGPNVSVPQAPNYVGPPQQQGWAPQPPPQQNWGGGGQRSGKAEPSPQPPGWWRVNGRSGPGFDAWKALREQQKDYVKGKIKWAGNADYWIDPSLGQWLSQQGFAVSQ